MFPCREHPRRLLRDLPLVQEHPEYLMPEDGIQLFQLQGRGDAEHALLAIETAVRHQNVTVRIESEKIAEGLDSDDGAWDGIIFRNRILDKNLQGFPGAAAEISKKLPVIEEIPTEDFRYAEYEMTVRSFLEHVAAQPFPEFYHALLMTRWTEVPALARVCQEIFMAAVFTFHTGKPVVQITAVEITIDHLLDIWPPEAVLPGEMLVIDLDKGFKIVLYTAVVIRDCGFRGR